MSDKKRKWIIPEIQFFEDQIDRIGRPDVSDHWLPTLPVGPSQFDTVEEDRGER